MSNDDEAKLIPEWGTCDSAPVGPIGRVDNHRFVLNFNDPSETLRSGVRVCYRYGSEMWIGYPTVYVPIFIDIEMEDQSKAIVGVKQRSCSAASTSSLRTTTSG